ncbi:MAG: endonuclease/exonuclease/phosphatase family protein [Planctomycetia bacterium]|nr:endonuclease/exonuclease/phosphatase family protein [Planctomycetia bacterium]
MLALVAALVCSPSGAGDDSCRLRIACFNAENLATPGESTRLTRFRFEPARKRHVERIADVIEAIDPDILVMPEVVSKAGVEAVAAILREKGLKDFRGYHVDGADSFSGFDVALFSRIEPDEIDGSRIHINVPKRRPARGGGAEAVADEGDGDDAWLRQPYTFVDDRGADRSEEAVLQRHAVAYFTVCGRKIALLGMHLKSNPADVGANAQRTAETRIARDIIRRRIVAKGYLPIVLGDLNDYDPDVPMADAVRKTQTTVLRDLKNYDETEQGPELVNAAARMPRVADRYTSHWDFNENGVSDGEDVFTMIDHILLHRDLEPAIRRAFVFHAIDLDVSDHYPVVVDLDLSRKR